MAKLHLTTLLVLGCVLLALVATEIDARPRRYHDGDDDDDDETVPNGPNRCGHEDEDSKAPSKYRPDTLEPKPTEEPAWPPHSKPHKRTTKAPSMSKKSHHHHVHVHSRGGDDDDDGDSRSSLEELGIATSTSRKPADSTHKPSSSQRPSSSSKPGSSVKSASSTKKPSSSSTRSPTSTRKPSSSQKSGPKSTTEAAKLSSSTSTKSPAKKSKTEISVGDDAEVEIEESGDDYNDDGSAKSPTTAKPHGVNIEVGAEGAETTTKSPSTTMKPNAEEELTASTILPVLKTSTTTTTEAPAGDF